MVSLPPITIGDPAPLNLPGTAGEILSTARTILAAGDLISSRAITRRLSLSPGALYAHYEDLEHLETVVVIDTLLRLAEHITTKTPPSSSPRERFLESAGRYREWALRHPHEFGHAFVTNGRPLHPGLTDTVQMASIAVGYPTMTALKDGWDSGDIGPAIPGPHTTDSIPLGGRILGPDEARVANALWAISHGIVCLELAQGVHDGHLANDVFFTWTLAAGLDAMCEPTN